MFVLVCLEIHLLKLARSLELGDCCKSGAFRAGARRQERRSHETYCHGRAGARQRASGTTCICSVRIRQGRRGAMGRARRRACCRQYERVSHLETALDRRLKRRGGTLAADAGAKDAHVLDVDALVGKCCRWTRVRVSGMPAAKRKSGPRRTQSAHPYARPNDGLAALDGSLCERIARLWVGRRSEPGRELLVELVTCNHGPI